MEENRSLIIAGAELLNKSKQAQHSTAHVRHEKIGSSVPIHRLDLAVQIDDNVPSTVKPEDSKPQHSSDDNIWLLTDRAEIVLF